MAGTIVVDRIESDASYASTINVAGQITFSNTVNFGAFAGTAPVAGFYLPTTNNLAFTTASTERMRIDSAGNVGIGTASPLERLRVQNTTGVNTTFTNSVDADVKINLTSGVALISPSTGVLALGTSSTERMRIDSSGNVGIGTASPDIFSRGYGKTVGINDSGSSGAALQINSASSYAALELGRGSVRKAFFTAQSTVTEFGNLEAVPLVFLTNSAERMRIDSSGNLLVGKTATTIGTVGTAILPSGRVQISNATTTSADDGIQIYSTGASAYRFFVTMAGVVNATSATITAISDQRLKENIRDLDDGLDVVMALKPRKFDWKEGKGADTKNARGFIAQEFETVFPDLIDTWKDEAPEGEEPYKAVRADLIPTLVKAIQEQQALITSLTARITALESN